eukprot:15365825-Ditylum_brightwellii.AAC.3
MPIPRWTNNKAARAVGSYKDILQGYGNPQEEMVVDNSTEFNHNLNPICSRKYPSIDLDTISQVTTTTYATQAPIQTPINAITQEQLTQQLATFQEEMAASNKRFSKEREKQLKEDSNSIITTKIESVQQELAEKFTADMKNAMHQQQTEMQNTIQQQQAHQQELTQASFQR